MTQKTVDEYAGMIMTAIRTDIGKGLIPADVESFSALHDYVDANEYAEEASVPLPLVDGLYDCAVVNAVTDEVDRRIKAGLLASQ